MRTILFACLLATLSAEAIETNQNQNMFKEFESQPRVSTDVQQRIQDKRALIEQKSLEWSLGTFTVITATNFDGNLERRLQNAFTPKTISALKDLFHSLNEDSFESFMQYRTNRAQCTLNFDGPIGQTMNYHAINKGVIFPEEPMAKARKIWEILSQGGTNKTIPKVLSVDLDKIQVTIERSTNPECNLGQRALKSMNNLAATSKSLLIRYDETPQKIIQRDGALQLLLCHAVVRFSSSAKPGYLMVALYWSEPDQRWLPWELSTDASSKFHRLF